MGKSRRSGAARKRRQKNWWDLRSTVERNAKSMGDGVSFELFRLGFLIFHNSPSPTMKVGFVNNYSYQEVEARYWSEEWEETHVVKLRWLVVFKTNNEPVFCFSIVFSWCEMYILSEKLRCHRRKKWRRRCVETVHLMFNQTVNFFIRWSLLKTPMCPAQRIQSWRKEPRGRLCQLLLKSWRGSNMDGTGRGEDSVHSW